MFRSSSATRMSDEHLLPPAGAAAAAARRSLLEADGLPSYDPHSDISKKLVQRARLSENAVHVIPVVVVLCAIILWFFSAHVMTDDGSIRDRGMTIVDEENSDER